MERKASRRSKCSSIARRGSVISRKVLFSFCFLNGKINLKHVYKPMRNIQLRGKLNILETERDN